MRDQLEFHFPDGRVRVVESSHAPDCGDLINIAKVTYQVIARSYTVDHINETRETAVVCMLTLELSTPEP